MMVTVYGTPQPAGSKKAFKHAQTGRIVVMDDAKRSRPWKQEIVATVRQDLGNTFFSGPVQMHLTFYVGRPKGHYGTGRNADTIRKGAPLYPTVKPDLTKLVRAVEDALTVARVWVDDAQVVQQTAKKLYGAPERVEIRVDPMWFPPREVEAAA